MSHTHTHTHTQTTEYYLAIKRNEIIPSAATWIDQEIIKLTEVSQKDKYDIIYMWNLKYETNEFIYETDSQTPRIDLWFPKGRMVRDE